MTGDPLFASPDWSLEQAAVAMIRGGFRHVIVIEGAEVAGMLSMRDVVRCWTDDGASCEVPALAADRRRESAPVDCPGAEPVAAAAGAR